MPIFSRSVLSQAAVIAFGFGATGLLVGCGGAADATVAKGDGGVALDASTVVPTDDGSAPAVDGSPAPGVDAGPLPDAGPPAPRNSSCTPSSAQTGTLVNTSHGRLDGTLVYVLPVDGAYSCNGDSSHVHLQVEVSGLVYDVAVDIGSSGDDVGMYEETLAIPGGTWAEGWHGADSLAYPSLGLKSTSFPTTTPADIASQVESLLTSTSKISIFCTGYTPGDNGCHDVHYEDGTGKDGAIVLDPTAATSPILFFRFQGQSF
jgi:hypothetical protein